MQGHHYASRAREQKKSEVSYKKTMAVDIVD